MYCNYCRSLNPDDAVYCSACGRTIRSLVEQTAQPAQSSQSLGVPAIARISATKKYQEDLTSQPISPSSSGLESSAPTAIFKPSAIVTASYGEIIFSLICFTAGTAFWAFSLALATSLNTAAAFEKVGVAIFVPLFTAIWAKRTWSKILLTEPETNPLFSRKHRSFSLRAGASVATVILAAGGYGTYLAIQKARFNGRLEQVRVLGAKSAPTKQRFIETVRRHTATIPQYLQRCRELESALNDYEPALQQMDGLLALVQEDLKSDQMNMRTTEMLRTILQKDLEGTQVYRQEIASAKQLASLPSEEQVQFIKDHIVPIRDKENSIANDEIEILKNAKAQGIKLPEQMYKDAGIE